MSDDPVARYRRPKINGQNGWYFELETQKVKLGVYSYVLDHGESIGTLDKLCQSVKGFKMRQGPPLLPKCVKRLQNASCWKTKNVNNSHTTSHRNKISTDSYSTRDSR